jgi:hypothetical protein
MRAELLKRHLESECENRGLVECKIFHAQDSAKSEDEKAHNHAPKNKHDDDNCALKNKHDEDNHAPKNKQDDDDRNPKNEHNDDREQFFTTLLGLLSLRVNK